MHGESGKRLLEHGQSGSWRLDIHHGGALRGRQTSEALFSSVVSRSHAGDDWKCDADVNELGVSKRKSSKRKLKGERDNVSEC